jgi:hypothetical protein
MKVFRIALLVTLALLPITSLTWTPGSRAADEDRREGLRGSWVVAVTPGPAFLCDGPGGPQIAPPGPPFTELATYAAGGTLTETNTILNANSSTLVPGLPFNASDGQGQWERDGSKFEATFRKLVFDTNGNYIGNADIAENIPVHEPDANKFLGQFTIQFSFLNGNPPVCSSGSLAAQRIHAD